MGLCRFEQNLISVQDVSLWGKNKKFTDLKEIPKNGEQRIVCLNEQMISILESQRRNRSMQPCNFFRKSTGERLDFVFAIEGQPASYRSIQYQYNMALKRAGLFPEFSSTHILRKAMANITRQELGLDAAQVAGGWKSRAIVERTYTNAPTALGQKVVNHIGTLIESRQLPRVLELGDGK